MPHLWTENESIDEIRHKLVCTKYELASARMEANTEIRKYEETIKRLFQLLKTVCQERDEARHQIQVLLRKMQPCTSKDTSKKPSMTESTKECSDMNSKLFTSRSLDSDRTKTNKADYVGPSRDIMVDRLVWGKPLPQKGRLLRTVTEAGPLLHTLLLAPLPQWQNPPPFDNDIYDKVDDVIPTSLSLAFPGNSRMSSASVDVDSDTMHDHMLAGKKRRLL